MRSGAASIAVGQTREVPGGMRSGAASIAVGQTRGANDAKAWAPAPRTRRARRPGRALAGAAATAAGRHAHRLHDQRGDYPHAEQRGRSVSAGERAQVRELGTVMHAGGLSSRDRPQPKACLPRGRSNPGTDILCSQLAQMPESCTQSGCHQETDLNRRRACQGTDQTTIPAPTSSVANWPRCPSQSPGSIATQSLTMPT